MEGRVAEQGGEKAYVKDRDGKLDGGMHGGEEGAAEEYVERERRMDRMVGV